MQSRVGALVLAVIVVASACVGEDPSGSPADTEPPGPVATVLTPPPSPAPSPSPSMAPSLPSTAPGAPVTLRLVADAALARSLPTQIGPVTFVRHSLATGDVPPSGFDDDLGRLLLRAAGKPDGQLAVAWIDPVPEQSAAVGGLTIVAVRIRGSEGRRLRALPLVDRMLEPGTTGSFGGLRDDEGPPFLFAVDRLTMSAGDVVYIVTYPASDPSATPDPNATPEISLDAIGTAFTGLDPVGPPTQAPDTTFPPDPGGAPDASLMPAPELEARLPDAIRGIPLSKASAHGDSIHNVSLVAFPIYALWLGGLDLPLDDLSVAVAHADALSSYVVIASDTGPHDPRETLAAYFATLAGSRTVEFETLEAGGRIAIFETSGGPGVMATEDTFYWMDYLDFGDCWCTQPPRDPVRDLVLDTLKALP